MLNLAFGSKYGIQKLECTTEESVNTALGVLTGGV